MAEYKPVFDEATAKALAVAARRGNDLANTEMGVENRIGNDIENIAARRLYNAAREDRIRTETASRNILQAGADTALGATSAFVGMVGGLTSATIGAAGALDEAVDPTKTGLAEFSVDVAKTTSDVTSFIDSFKSNELQGRSEMSQIESVLDEQDSQAQYAEDLASGRGEGMSGWAKIGRDFTNSGERIMRDGAVAADVVAQGLGSLAPSAMLAGGGVKLLQGAMSKVTSRESAMKLAATLGSAGGVGVAEATGVYMDTVNTIMDRTPEEMGKSVQYNELVAGGVDPLIAQSQVAANAAMEAATRQLPAAAAMGLIAARFNAAPLQTFKGQSLISGLGEVGKQSLEEAGQGAVGQLNQNIAIAANVDPEQSLIDGLGEQLAVGAIAGAGMAGVIGGPSMAMGGVDLAKSAAQSQTAADILSGAVAGSTAVGRRVADVAAPVANAAVGVVAPIAQQAKIEFDSRLDESINATPKDEQSEALAAATQAQSWADTQDPATVAPSVIAAAGTKSTTPVPASFVGSVPEGGSVIQSLGGVLDAVSTGKVKISKMSESDLLYTAGKVRELLNADVATLPTEMQAGVVTMLKSNDLKRIKSRLKEIDLNKTMTAETEITPTVVTDTLTMAKEDPTKVQPEVAARILEQNQGEISDTDVKLLSVGVEVASAINAHVEANLEVQKKNIVELSNKPNYQQKPSSLPKADPISRDLSVGEGNGDSLNELASSIIKGVQNNGEIDGKDGIKTPVALVANHLSMLAQHMVNKTLALNESFDANNEAGKGPTIGFRSIHRGKAMVDPGDVRSARGVFYHRSNETSVNKARVIAADAKVAVDVYNAMAKAFPEMFPDGLLEAPVLREAVASVSKTETSDTQAPLSETGDTQTEQTPEPVEQSPAATTADEEVASPLGEGTDESQAAKTEVADPTLDEDGEDIITVRKDRPTSREAFEALSDEELMVSANSYTPNIQSTEMDGETAGKVADLIESMAAKFGFPDNMVRSLAFMKSKKASHKGQAYWDERIISIRQDVAEAALAGDKDSIHIIMHEFAHIIDAAGSKKFGRTASMDNGKFDVDGTGEIHNEKEEARRKYPEMAAFFSYVETQNGSPDIYSSELFAEIASLYLQDPVETRKILPKGVAYVETIISQAGGTIPTVEAETTTSDTETSSVEGDTNGSEPAVSGNEVSVLTELKDRTNDNLDPKFGEVFEGLGNDMPFKDGVSMLDHMEKMELADSGYLEFARKILNQITDKVNDRLETVKFQKSKADSLTIAEMIRAGRMSELLVIRDYMGTMFVDPATQKYDPQLLSLAISTVTDWMTSARSADPAQFTEVLERLNIDPSTVTEEELNDILNGINYTQAVEGMAFQVMKAWDVRDVTTAREVEVRGSVEGLLKEILTVLTQNDIDGLIDENGIEVPTRLLELKKITFDGDKTTYTLRLDGLKTVQEGIGMNSRDAMKGILLPEDMTMPSVGDMFDYVDQKQTRGGVSLTGLQKTALKNIQDIPHFVASNDTQKRGITNLTEALGKEVVSRILGSKPVEFLNKNHPLRSSIEGKNLAISRDYDDAMLMLKAVRGHSENRSPVFYRVGISRVGRHQMKGINPQNNKILRALITATHATLDMNDQADRDAFWLTVAQGSELYKVENKFHEEILANVEGEFRGQYAEALRLLGEWMNGGELDAAAFEKAMVGNKGTAEMAQINSVIAVAQLDYAMANGTQGAFETSISFELDGKTDGPGNMMNNFGQGEMSEQDFTNFQRVGYFLGTKAMTLNKFFGGGQNVDLYNVTSKNGQTVFDQMIREAKPGDKARLIALRNFSVHFGTLEMQDDGSITMTRATSKGPMTQTVYGSGVAGVSGNIAQEMLLSFYEKMVFVPRGENPEVALGYPGLKQDFERIFGKRLSNDTDWTQTFMEKKDVKKFEEFVTDSLGEVLSKTAKKVIGDPITEVNDLLVFMTGVQTQFVQDYFEVLMEAKAEELAAAGKIARNKQGKGVRRQMTKADRDSVVKAAMKFSPVYSNGSQTLAIGAFEKTISDIEMSSNMDGNFRAKSTAQIPALSGVKVIPYLTISTDGMMMNNIFGNDNAPKDVLPVFDGVDMSVKGARQYSQQINDAVRQNWDTEILPMVLKNFDDFLAAMPEDQLPLLEKAFAATTERAKDSTMKETSVEAMRDLLAEKILMNRARKNVFKKIPRAIDHMGGSDTAVVTGPDGKTYTRVEINREISKEIARLRLNPESIEDAVIIEDTPPPADDDADTTPADPKAVPTLTVATTGAKLKALMKETKNKRVRDTLKAIEHLIPGDVTVVTGSTAEELNAYRRDNYPESGSDLFTVGGIYDVDNNVIFILSDTHETLAHELVHLATFTQVLAHFNGAQNDAVARLETLMTEFMGMDFSKSYKPARDAVNKARAAILRYQGQDTPYNRAAAVNEFMAWSLTNEALMKELSTKETNIAARMGKMVIALMQRLLGGVPKDMLSNIRFNTQIINDVIVEEAIVADPVDPDGDLTEDATFTNFWIDRIRGIIADTKAVVGDRKKVEQLVRYKTTAQEAVDALDFGGFNLTEYQKSTFRAMHMVLALDMKIDTQSMIAVTDLFKFVSDNLTPAMFGEVNPDQRYAAVMELMGGSKNDQGRSDAMATLLALSQTSRGFRAALDQLPRLEGNGGLRTGSMNDLLSSATVMLVSKAIGNLQMDGLQVAEALDKLSDSIMDNDMQSEFRGLQTITASLGKGDSLVSKAMNTLAERNDERNEEMKTQDRNRVVQFISNASVVATDFLSEERAKIQMSGLKDVFHMGGNLSGIIPIREFMAEMVGTNETNRPVVALLDKVNQGVTKMRQMYREELPKVLLKSFKAKPSAAQAKAVHTVLGKGDAAALFTVGSPAYVFRLLANNALLDQKIANMEKTIKANFNQSTQDNIFEKAQQLADKMNGKGDGHMVLQNAYAINRLAGEYKAGMTSEIDKLISLYAMRGQDPDARQAVADLYAAEPDGMVNVLTYMAGLNKEEDMKSITEGARMMGKKGYIPNHGKGQSSVVIRDMSERNAMERRGYTFVSRATGSDQNSNIEYGYFRTTVKQNGIYSQGAMQNIQPTYRGVDATTGLSVDGSSSGIISYAPSVETLVNDLNAAGSVLDVKEVLTPVYNGDYEVEYFERVINPDVLELHTTPEGDIFKMLGVWAGRQVEEKFATQFNMLLVEQLRKIYDKAKADGTNMDLFINLADKKLKDKIYRDSWKVIPPATKDEIERQFGEGEFWVMKEMADLSVGYREASITDMWSGKTRMPEAVQKTVQAVSTLFMKKNAYAWMSTAEDTLENVVSTAKDLIVVRSLVVPYMNSQGNVLQLWNRGVGNKDIYRGYKAKFAEIDKMNEYQQQFMELDLQMQISANDKNRVSILQQQKDALQASASRMSIAPLVKAGLYKNISEGLTELDVEIGAGRLGDWVEAQVERIPNSKVRTFVKYGMVSKDTALYRGANKATQYGDFIAKAILFDHLMKTEGMTAEEAIAVVNEEFVNFSVLPGRVRSKLESLGATWFMTFKIRIMKQAAAQVRRNPVRSLILAAAPGDFVNSPVDSNLAAVAFKGTLPYSLGWDMMFGSLELNIWNAGIDAATD